MADKAGAVRTFEPGELRAAVADALWRWGNDRIGFREWSLVADAYQKEADVVLAALGIDGEDPVTVVRGRLEEVSREEISRGLLNKLYIVTRIPAAETTGSDAER